MAKRKMILARLIDLIGARIAVRVIAKQHGKLDLLLEGLDSRDLVEIFKAASEDEKPMLVKRMKSIMSLHEWVLLCHEDDELGKLATKMFVKLRRNPATKNPQPFYRERVMLAIPPHQPNQSASFDGCVNVCNHNRDKPHCKAYRTALSRMMKLAKTFKQWRTVYILTEPESKERETAVQKMAAAKISFDELSYFCFGLYEGVPDELVEMAAEKMAGFVTILPNEKAGVNQKERR